MTIELSRSIESVRPSVPIVGHADDSSSTDDAFSSCPILSIDYLSSCAIRPSAALGTPQRSMIQRVSSIQISLLLFILYGSLYLLIECPVTMATEMKIYKTRCRLCYVFQVYICDHKRLCCRGTGEKPLPTCSYLSISTSSFFRISLLFRKLDDSIDSPSSLC